uniref:Uncharacterized protein n=1 Tax=Schistosoma haematobium TaxID=6185 RepID=A0A094ZML7_SCHHA
MNSLGLQTYVELFHFPSLAQSNVFNLTFLKSDAAKRSKTSRKTYDILVAFFRPAVSSKMNISGHSFCLMVNLLAKLPVNTSLPINHKSKYFPNLLILMFLNKLKLIKIQKTLN